MNSVQLINFLETLFSVVGGAILTVLLAFFANQWREREQIRRPIAMEMKNITNQCHQWHDHIQDIESTTAETLDNPEVYTSPKNPSQYAYKENKDDIGVLTPYEINHIRRYYERVGELRYRMKEGMGKRDHVKVLTGHILREHDAVYNHLTEGVLYRLKARLFQD